MTERVDDPRVWERLERCFGKGLPGPRIEDGVDVTCFRCEGSGWVLGEDCPDCNGTGKTTP